LPNSAPLPREPLDPFDPSALVGPGLLAVVVHLPEAASTMDRARELAADPETAVPLAVVADRQTKGRGRRGAGWWQPPGSLVMSLVVEAAATSPSGLPPPTWSLASGVALAETIRTLVAGVPAVVRWPNDVEVAGRKLAGILVEAAPLGRAIFGIGVNTTGSAAAAPQALARRVATLPDLTGRPLGRTELMAEFLPRFFGLLIDLARDPALLVTRYRPLCGLTGREVTVHVGDRLETGRCGGITADGRLVLDRPAGQLLIASGSLTPPADVWPGDGSLDGG
jgi:BirA family biotin operon repressor/biotin-[acetyl-CoA-carboxylase] ligase